MDPAEYAGNMSIDPWALRVDGEVENPGTLNLEDIQTGFDLEERIYRLRCVEAWSMVVPWVGYSLSSLLARFKPTSRAKYVQFYTLHDPKQMRGQRSFTSSGNAAEESIRPSLRITLEKIPVGTNIKTMATAITRCGTVNGI